MKNLHIVTSECNHANLLQTKVVTLKRPTNNLRVDVKAANKQITKLFSL